MEQLSKLEYVKSSTNICTLRGLHEKITVHIRSLSSMDIDSQHFGPMLIPVVVELLPNDRVQVDIPTARYSDSLLFRQLLIPTSRCSDTLRKKKTRYSDKYFDNFQGSLFRQLDIPTFQY